MQMRHDISGVIGLKFAKCLTDVAQSIIVDVNATITVSILLSTVEC